jgi:hypothetical protein
MRERRGAEPRPRRIGTLATLRNRAQGWAVRTGAASSRHALKEQVRSDSLPRVRESRVPTRHRFAQN